jgi:hypothetical protein
MRSGRKTLEIAGDKLNYRVTIRPGLANAGAFKDVLCGDWHTQFYESAFITVKMD